MRYRADVGGRTLTLEVDRDGTVLVDGVPLEADAAALGGEVYSLIVGRRSHEVVVLDREEGALRVAVDGRELAVALAGEREQEARAHLPAPSLALELRAPMPGLIVAVHVGEGEVIAEGGSVCTLEAMKMENELTAPRRARVTQLRARAGAKVNGGELLAVLRPE